MLERMRAKIRSSARFPKRSTADLMWLKNVWIAFGIIWIALGLFGWSGWTAVASVLLGIAWLVESALTVKEIRRRKHVGGTDVTTENENSPS